MTAIRKLIHPAALSHVGAVTTLGLLVWLAYAPSLRHGPRSDQWCFLVDSQTHHSLLDTLQFTYSYNRTRRIAPGDTDLFRPVVFATLSAEKAFCEADLGAMQMIGILLHGGVCLLLLVVFRQLQRANNPEYAKPWSDSAAAWCLPYAVVAFFALNPSVQELVIWTHLHGYLVFLVLLLGSITLLLRHLSHASVGSWSSPSLVGSWLLALAACFTYELGQVYTILAGLMLAIHLAPIIGVRRALTRFAVFALLALIYQSANVVDMQCHPGEYVPDRNHLHIRDRLFQTQTIEHSVRFAIYTTIQPFFPSVVETRFQGDRLEILESLWTRHGRRNLGPAVVVSAVVIVMALVMGAAGARRVLDSKHRIRLFTFILFASLFGIYSGMNVLGRMNLRPTPEILSANSYYTYFALLFVVIAGFALISALEPSALWTKPLRVGFSAALLILAITGAEKVRNVNQIVATGMSEIVKPIRTVNTFVRHHRHEDDFSFRIDYASSDRIVPVYGLPTTDVLFAKWMTPIEPKYRIAIRKGSIIVVSVRHDREQP